MNRNERLDVITRAEVCLGVCVDELLSMHKTYCPDCKGGCPTLRYVEAARAAKLHLAKLWLELDDETKPTRVKRKLCHPLSSTQTKHL